MVDKIGFFNFFCYLIEDACSIPIIMCIIASLFFNLIFFSLLHHLINKFQCCSFCVWNIIISHCQVDLVAGVHVTSNIHVPCVDVDRKIK